MPATPAAERDAHSYAVPSDARVTHVALDLTADFAAHVLAGHATLTIEAVPTATTLILDTRDLVIQGVTDGAGEPLHYELGPEDRILGRALKVTLPADRHLVTVSYRTSPRAAALQWLQPAQTAGASTRTCSRRARQSSRARGSRRRTVQASARPTKRASSRQRR
jgi:aminopeptidase N